MAAVPSGWRTPCALCVVARMSPELGVEGLPRAQPLGSAPPVDVEQQVWICAGRAGGEARGSSWGGLVSQGNDTERPGRQDTGAAAAAFRFRAGLASWERVAIAGTAERSGWPSSSPAASPGARCSPPAPPFYPALNGAEGSRKKPRDFHCITPFQRQSKVCSYHTN